MRKGDLVKYQDQCEKNCSCFFCHQKSNRIGIVLETWIGEDDRLNAIVEFDVGEWMIYGCQDENKYSVIGEA